MCLLTYSATPPDTHGYVTVRPHPAIVDAQEALIRELMDTTSPDWIGRTGQAQGRLAALVRAKHNGALPAVPSTNLKFAASSTLQADANHTLAANRTLAISPNVAATIMTGSVSSAMVSEAQSTQGVPKTRSPP